MDRFLFICEKSNDKLLYDDFQTYFNSKFEVSSDSKIYIGPNMFHKEAVIEEIDLLVGYIQREWFLFQSIALYDNIISLEEIIYARELINKCFQAIKESLQICDCPLRQERYKKKVANELKYLFNTVIPINSMRDDFVIKLSSWKSNDIKNPVYQYFHTYLEMEYYLLFLTYTCEGNVGAIDEAIDKLVSNLIHFSKMNFQRQTRQVFACCCIKNVWLLIQFLYEKTKTNPYCFWDVFNKKIENEDPIFSLWLLTEVASLQLIDQQLQHIGNSCCRITPNYDLLLNKLKSTLVSADSDTLLKIFEIINNLLTDYWIKNAKIEIYQTIWDFYSKRLNMSKKNYSKFNALDFNNSINHILSSPGDCDEDFEKFISILIIHLKEYPSHWGKMKGRIYSQLGPQKLKDLNEVGIVHVIFLFSALSTLNYEELLKKIITFFEGIAQEKKHNSLTWNALMAFIFMQVKQGLTVEKTGSLLLSWIKEASLDSKNFHLIKTFFTNFEHVLNFSLNMQLHQWIVLDYWLSRYLSNCYYNDMTSTFDTLLITIEKVENPDSWSLWSESFQTYVYPVLKQLSHTQNAPETIGKIAGKMCLLMPVLYNEIFNYFTGYNISPKIGLNFLTVALADYPNSCILTTQQEFAVIRMWIKICLLMSEPCGYLTKIVTKLDYFPIKLKSHLNTSHDPFKAFIEYLGSDINSHKNSVSINKLCDISLGHIDKWLKQFLAHPDNEQTVLRIYVYFSLAFLHCSPLLYTRNSSSSVLTTLIDCLLLPSEVQLGKTPHEYVLNSVKKTWTLFYEGLVLLRDDTDMYLERTLKDLITKYMQHFSTSDSPIIKCFDNERIAEVVLEKISISYFNHPVKESDSNLIKAIKIMSDTVQSTTSVALLRLVITKTLCGLFELVIFHRLRNIAINLLKVICSSPLYPQIKHEFASCVTSTTEKHLAFYATNYFQLMFILAKFVPGDVKTLIKTISQHIGNVEQLKGVGFDVNLRSQLDKLENIIKLA